MSEFEKEMWLKGRFDFVIVKFLSSSGDRVYLFKAPYLSVTEGDVVRCDTKIGDRYGIAQHVIQGADDDKAVCIIKALVHATEPVSLINGVAHLETINYDEILF